MKLLKTIVVAVDFDDTTGDVLTAASKLAKKFQSELVLLHVIEASEESADEHGGLQGTVLSRLNDMRAQLAAEGIATAETLCEHGKASVEIVNVANRLDANLILLGTRGVAADHHFPFGTTTERVIRGSAKPVLAVQPGHELQLASILCPVDCSDTSARGLTNAIRLARAFKSKLHVVTVLPPPSRYHRLDQYWAQWAATAEATATVHYTREFEGFLGQFDFRDVRWEKHLQRGDAAHEIIAGAKAWNTDLIVMGSLGRSGLPYLLMGSTAVKVARQLPCSLLTVKREQVMAAYLEQNIADINAAFQEGHELLAQGFCQEALAQFDRCLHLDPHFAHALDAKAETHERMGHAEQADECRKLAELIRRELWDQQVTASVRAHHPFFHRRGPYDS
jgi:nucleotide-binding universal stress UspA family protein